jgi:hypothetical protein
MIWRSTRGDEFCVVQEPNIEASSDLDRGVPRLRSMEVPARCNMDPSFPKEVRLSDNLYGATMSIVSQRLKTALEVSKQNRVEFLPVEVVNHKGRVEEREYYILHPLDMVDCIDLVASGVEWNRIAPDRISRCKSLVLNPKAIPECFSIFRPKHWGRLILIREDLVEKLRRLDFEGLYFRPIEEYKGIG